MRETHPEDVKAIKKLALELCERYDGDSYTVQTFATYEEPAWRGWPDGWYEFIVHVHKGQEAIVGTKVHCTELD